MELYTRLLFIESQLLQMMSKLELYHVRATFFRNFSLLQHKRQTLPSRSTNSVFLLNHWSIQRKFSSEIPAFFHTVSSYSRRHSVVLATSALFLKEKAAFLLLSRVTTSIYVQVFAPAELLHGIRPDLRLFNFFSLPWTWRSLAEVLCGRTKLSHVDSARNSRRSINEHVDGNAI